MDETTANFSCLNKLMEDQSYYVTRPGQNSVTKKKLDKRVQEDKNEDRKIQTM